MISGRIHGVPSRNAPCLCGSQRRFKSCCANFWEDAGFREDHARLASEGDFVSAAKSLRAWITWYRICHERHTKVLLKRDCGLGAEILAIDIDALFELSYVLLRYLSELGSESESEAFISSASLFVDDPRWVEKWHLLSILAKLGSAWDDEQAKVVVRNLGSLDQYNDPELLMVALDVLSNELGFGKAYRTCERIERLVHDSYYKLQYGTLAAVLLLLASDRGGAVDRLRDVIQRFDAEEQDFSSTTPYQLSELAKTMGFAQQLMEDADFGRRGIVAINRLLECGSLNTAGLSDTHLRKAWLLRDMGDFDGAISSFRAAYAANGNAVACVFEAESEAMKGNFDRAISLLGAVDQSGLDEAGLADLAFVSARCAVSVSDRTLMSQARDRLNLLELKDALFLLERSNLLREIDVALVAPLGAAQVPKLKLLELVSRYLDMRPNFCGLGLNINAMLDDFADRRERKRIASGSIRQAEGHQRFDGK